MGGSNGSVLFLSDTGVPGCLKLTYTPFANLTDVTLADEDTNSILTDNVNRAIKGNVAMKIVQSGCQL